MTHLEAVDKVWVRRQGGGSLEDRLEREYRGRWEEEELRVLLPRVGMRCMIRGQENQACRAEVCSLKGEGRVEVRLVDSGLKEVVHCNSL